MNKKYKAVKMAKKKTGPMPKWLYDELYVESLDFKGHTLMEFAAKTFQLTVDRYRQVKHATPEELKQNEHVQGLLEILEFYSNGWVKKHPRLNSFGIPEETYVNEVVKSDGGKRAREALAPFKGGE